MPDPAHRAALWPALGAPGAVLSGVDVIGVWRPRARGTVLDLTVEAFRPPTPAERAAVTEEARRLATVRGAREATVSWTGAA